MMAPALEVIGRAMDALESDATVEQRRAAWDELRDTFFPVTPAPAPLTRRERETIDIALSRGPVATTEARAFAEPDLPRAPRG